MGEIRLTCPECGMKYSLAPDAIPAGGREVECTACGHVWQATPQQAEPLMTLPRPAGHDDSGVVRHENVNAPTPGPVNLSRKLPDNVLSILRDEVEYERKARASDDILPVSPQSNPDWPATTITAPATRPVAEPDAASTSAEPSPRLTAPAPTSPAAPARPAPQAAYRAPSAVSHVTPPSSPAITAAAAAIVKHDRVQNPQTPLHNSPLVKSTRRTGYWPGFGLAAMIATAALALYLLAPRMADSGAIGDGLNVYRAQVDLARTWLADSTARFLGSR